MGAAFEIADLTASYGEFRALSGLSLGIAAGETLALVGANGAGKSTLMKVLTGLMGGWQGRITVNGAALPPQDPRAAAAQGIALVPEGRLLFDSLTVEENLQIARSGRKGPWDLAAILALFPVLAEKRHARPATLSGGQQQMVAIGRALAANPAIRLCDEISLGLSPLVVDEVYAALASVRAQGVTLVIVDQDIARVTARADRVACLFKGRITHQGPAAGTTPASLHNAYFGAAA
jgi:branched-chain amino acid transport system ATP-binding protein